MWVCFGWGKALNGQSFSFDGNDSFWWRMLPERKCLGGPGRFEIETPHQLPPLLVSLPPSHSLPLSLLHPSLPPHWLDPWMWLWAQQPCNPPLPCSKGLSYLRTRHLCRHSSGKKHCFIHPCVCVCVCDKTQKWAQTVNGDWRHATPRGYERAFISLISQKSSPCQIGTSVPLTRQTNLDKKKGKKKSKFLWTCATLWKILLATYVTRWNFLLLLLLSSRPASLWCSRG